MKTKLIILVTGALAALVLYACGGTRKIENYDFMESTQGFDLADSNKTIFVSSFKSIDSVDHDKLLFDVYRLDTTGYPKKIKIFTRVYDSLGNFVTNMAPPYLKDSSKKYFTRVEETLGRARRKTKNMADFTVREYGANDSIPYNLALTVDYSGSMTALMGVLFEGTEMFVRLKSKYDNITLSSFNRDYFLKVPLISDTAKILSLYRSNFREGVGLFSAVYDAAVKSIELLKDRPSDVPRVLVIFTDGDDNYSQTALDSLIKIATDNKVFVFTVAFGYSKSEKLRYLSWRTGGKYYKAYSKKDLIAVFRDIYMSLKYFYLVEYTPPRFWGLHTVRLSLNTPKRLDTLFAFCQYETNDLRTEIAKANPDYDFMKDNLAIIEKADWRDYGDNTLADFDGDNSGNRGDGDSNRGFNQDGSSDGGDGNKNTDGDNNNKKNNWGNDNNGNKNSKGDNGGRGKKDGGDGNNGNNNLNDGKNNNGDFNNNGNIGNKNLGGKDTSSNTNNNRRDNNSKGDNGNRGKKDGGDGNINNNNQSDGNNNNGDFNNNGNNGNKNSGSKDTSANKNSNGNNSSLLDNQNPLDPYGFDGNKFARPILFDFNEATIKPESYHIIEEIADEMVSWKRLEIEVQGHTDSVGTEEFNQDLSVRRAQAVMNQLIKLGVEPRRLKYSGFGETMPIVPNDSEQNMALNRRTVFVILKM